MLPDGTVVRALLGDFDSRPRSRRPRSGWWCASKHEDAPGALAALKRAITTSPCSWTSSARHRRRDRGHLPPALLLARRGPLRQGVAARTTATLLGLERLHLGAAARARDRRALRPDARRSPEPQATAHDRRHRPAAPQVGQPIRTVEEVRTGERRPRHRPRRTACSPRARTRPGEAPAGIRRIPSGVDAPRDRAPRRQHRPSAPVDSRRLASSWPSSTARRSSTPRVVGYLHRGIEKLGENRRYHQLGTLMDRGDYVSGIHGELAAALAVEQLMEVEVAAQGAVAAIAHVGDQPDREPHGLVRDLRARLRRDGTVPLRDARPRGASRCARGGHRSAHDVQLRASRRSPRRHHARCRVRRSATFLRTIDGYLDEHDALLGGNEIFQQARARHRASSTARPRSRSG
jgi:hypothetical protein